jgi:hypothetical protein
LLYNKCGDLVVILYYRIPTWVAEALTFYLSKLRSVFIDPRIDLYVADVETVGYARPLVEPRPYTKIVAASHLHKEIDRASRTARRDYKL